MRRHLTPSQLAMVAARARELYDQQAKERQRASGGNHKKKAVVENLPQPDRARDAAGKAVKAETARIRATWSERTHRVRAGLQRASDPPPRYEFPMVDARLLGER